MADEQTNGNVKQIDIPRFRSDLDYRRQIETEMEVEIEAERQERHGLQDGERKIDLVRFRSDNEYYRKIMEAAQVRIDAREELWRHQREDLLQFPTPEYVHEADRYIYSRVNMSFAQASQKWSFTDRHELKLELEKVPQRSTGPGDDWEAPETGIALDLTFKRFALERGLLPPSYFEEPGHEALTVEEVIEVAHQAAAKYPGAARPPLWQRALQRLGLS